MHISTNGDEQSLELADEQNPLDVISSDQYTILPNTAGYYTAEDAVRTCRKALEAGREAYLAGRMPRQLYTSASSPIDGTFF